MLGMDVAVTLALLLSLASALLCVVYGAARWNADDDPSATGAAPPTPEGSAEPGHRSPE